MKQEGSVRVQVKSNSNNKTSDISAIFTHLDTLTSMQEVYGDPSWTSGLSHRQRFNYLIHRWGAFKAYSLFLIALIMVAALPFAALDLLGFDHGSSQKGAPTSSTTSPKATDTSASIIELNTSDEKDCLKITRVPNDSYELIARKFQVHISSVRFLRASYGVRTGGPTAGYRGCNLHFDSAQGPIYCSALDIYSNDGGRTAMGFFYTVGVSENANLCY